MSNLIKFYNFNVTPNEKKLVDWDSRVGEFVPGIVSHGEVRVRDLEREQFDAEFPEEMFEEGSVDEQQDFMPEAMMENVQEQVSAMMEQAEREAAEFLEKAKVSANFEREAILEESRKQGYREGLIQANEEVAAEREELEQMKIQLQEEYNQLVEELEPNFVRLVMALVKKFTGVLVEDRRDIIVYLMEQSLKNLGTTKKIRICVSSQDYDRVICAENRIREIVSSGCEVEIAQEPSMQLNQCIIEADNKIIDCSLDVQLQGLMEDLKMLI